MSEHPATPAVPISVLVAMPFNSRAGFNLAEEAGWRPISELSLSVNSSLFPNAEYLDYDVALEVAGRNVTLARLFRLDRQSAYLELSIELPDAFSLDQKSLHEIYKAIYTFQEAASDPLFVWAKDRLGSEAQLAWNFTINLISGPKGTHPVNHFESLIGPVIESKDYGTMAVSSLDAVVMGETGGWLAMSDQATSDDLTTARFWLSRVQLAYSAIQFLLSELMDQRREILRTKRISTAGFDRFLVLKQQVVGLIFKISPGANAANWLDIQIYKFCFGAWQLDTEKQNLLEMLDRIEGVVANLEERRIRRNSFLVSLLINVITLTGLFAVLDYFVNFSGRQGFDMSVTLSVERLAVCVVLALISVTALVFTVRNR